MKTIDKIVMVAAIVATALLCFEYLNAETIRNYKSWGLGGLFFLRERYFQVCAGVIVGSIAWFTISFTSRKEKA